MQKVEDSLKNLAKVEELAIVVSGLSSAAVAAFISPSADALQDVEISAEAASPV